MPLQYNCKYHKERENDGFPAFVEDGGCPIEDDLETSRFVPALFPRGILEVYKDDKCVNYHHCPFFERSAK